MKSTEVGLREEFLKKAIAKGDMSDLSEFTKAPGPLSPLPALHLGLWALFSDNSIFPYTCVLSQRCLVERGWVKGLE